MLGALHGLVLVSLWGHLLVWWHPSLLWLSGCDCLWDTSLWCWCAWYTPFFTPCDDVMLALLVFYHFFGFLCFFTFLHACLHASSHLSLIHKTPSLFLEFCLMACVSSILQSNGTIDIQSKHVFVLLGHLFCLITCLCAPIWLSLHALFTFLLSTLLVYWLLSLFVACTYIEWGC